ncbi:hypothetical protein IW261DRAFT_1560225 [Armillaria novae-zelandiae]|uniref:Uncharacterized protein n=1 Tax=Armillaria novae-zelandiae TaxID=153914 RepID=A0AA39UF39_9AGAR|nr:hypothetical protein IW261DRAFT_1560225 [Armillaria novae-zelandiae]
MPYQPPTAPGFAIAQINGAWIPWTMTLMEPSPFLSPSIRDSINSAGAQFLPVFNNQVLSNSLTWHDERRSASISNLAVRGMDLAIALMDARDVGFVVGVKLSWLASNCLLTPLLPAPAPLAAAGELLPVVRYFVQGTISRSNIYFTLVYLLNHDQANLFYAVLGHASVFSPYWRPFRAGARKTADPPTVLVDDILERGALCLRRMPLGDLERLEVHVKGFLHVQNTLHISDMGFHEVIRACCVVVNRALRKPEDDGLNGLLA